MDETSRTQRRAVVVDGMVRSARTIGQFLRIGLDYNVIAEVPDVSLALDACGAEPPELLVIDAGVFGEHSRAALTMVCQHCPDTRVVVVAEEAAQGSRQDLYHTGADAVVSKPVRLSELQQAIRQAFAMRRRAAHAPAKAYRPSNFQPDVLVVEDEAVTRALLVSAVSKANVSLLGAAPTLARASSLLSMARPWVLLLDITLPDGDGLDWLGLLPPQLRPVTIVITAHAEERRVSAAKDIGVVRYLLKPVRPIEVVRQLQRAVEIVSERMLPPVDDHTVAVQLPDDLPELSPSESVGEVY